MQIFYCTNFNKDAKIVKILPSEKLSGVVSDVHFVGELSNDVFDAVALLSDECADIFV